MQICLRLPNWLGDVVMSLGFLHELQLTYPDATVDVIVKKGLQDVIQHHPRIRNVYIFSKEEYGGLQGVWRYGKETGRKHKYDIFFCLPDSFSSALMAYASGAKERIGYKKEGRSFLLTHVFNKPVNVHRAIEYAALLRLFNDNESLNMPSVVLPESDTKQPDEKYLVLNINSEAISRRMPVKKAVELIELLQQLNITVILTGAPKDAAHIHAVYNDLPDKRNIIVLAGKTNMQELIKLIQQSYVMVSVDSGPAHIASASGVPLVTISGADDEHNTGPLYNTNALTVRNGKLPCEPCVSNTCKLAPLPVCLMQLELQKVMTAVQKLLVNMPS